MALTAPLKHPIKVRQLMRRQLTELRRTPRELAKAVHVPESYIADLLAGRRRPPAPGRTDVYERMTRFLRLHRNDLPTCARAERAGGGEPGGNRCPDVKVRNLLLELCKPAKARLVKDRAALQILITQRLLEVAQGFVRRQLDDELGIRVAASREGRSYVEMRMRLLDFLDATPESLTVTDHEAFVRPRIAVWDIDLKTHAMRIVLRSSEPEPRQRRALRL